MFLGEYTHSVDPKGRVAIPVKFRPELAHGAVVTRGLDGCLFIYPQAEWQILAEKLKNLPITQADARAFVRLMFSGAFELEIDKQGRVNIPAYLLKYAHVEKETVIAGLFNRIEIWSVKAWEEYRAQSEGKSDVIAEHLASLGI
ncbi:cell division/cell wall cluster transcriptional repressor MraZ [Candidatus Wirthbacteria bacterium CG2_30_54_11]|uniref:Transcriptional regulator MraZ n=1 Tax=Candidatus Wirthbacteria bacterium CG2_30_54_11 TaxID=1817892 RepID=A0A1J5IWS8_9BACT|nr:MAG: cell division/cell wall cluster transcriptional repressor MraZ [Candidatus Wirthbacteria bacterium CG2_30_54_11]